MDQGFRWGCVAENMLWLRLSQFVTLWYQGLRFSRAVQRPPSAVVHLREVRRGEARRARQTLLPLATACSDTLGYAECDDCCEDRVERTWWRLHEIAAVGTQVL